MIVDLHVHTIYSGDSLIAPEEVIDQAVELGLDGICITEHDCYELSGVAELLAENMPIKVFRGVEVSTDLGHMLVYGVSDWQNFPKVKPVPAQMLIDFARERGGVCIPAHPFRFASDGIADRIETLAGIFAIEGWNGRCDAQETRLALDYAERCGLKVIGGSDAHVLGHLGTCVTVFENRVETIAELVAELKAGRFEACRLTVSTEYFL
ncbi:MAG: PHP domain-containing protein [Acidobacteriota bacterium]|nr:PHP domain-containing protein [Blastocatellia bacterium]MDW8413177.1 PHP domain-containing protein [Acidobacteriota bacterium]